MRYPRSVKIFRGQFDAAPFMGVFFLLLLFLLLQSHLVFPPGLEVELPAGRHQRGIPGPKVYLAIDANDQLYFNHQLSNLTDLRTQLSRLTSDNPHPPTLVILADGAVSQQRVMEISELAADCGVSKVALASRPMNFPEATLPQKP